MNMVWTAHTNSDEGFMLAECVASLRLNGSRAPYPVGRAYLTLHPFELSDVPP